MHRRLPLLLPVLLLFTGCRESSARPPTTPLSAMTAPRPADLLQGLDPDTLSPADRTVLTQAAEDFAAVLAGKQPIHAEVDEEAAVPADGGTHYYQGKGYRLTVVKSLSSFGEFHGYSYGPEITFDEQFAPGNNRHLSDVRIYSFEALDQLLQSTVER